MYEVLRDNANGPGCLPLVLETTTTQGEYIGMGRDGWGIGEAGGRSVWMKAHDTPCVCLLHT